VPLHLSLLLKINLKRHIGMNLPRMHILILSLLAVLSAEATRGNLEVIEASGDQVPYELFLPKSAPPPGTKSPILVFLHGRGESGAFDVTNAQSLPLQLLANASFAASFPFITLVPQCPASCAYENGWSEAVLQGLARLVPEVASAHGGDLGRVYLAGQSMGGNGAWMFASQQKNMFAAVVVVCGYGGSPKDQSRIAERLVRSGTAVGVVHAADDSVIDVSAGDEMVEAIATMHSAREGSGAKLSNIDSVASRPPNTPLLRYWRYAHAPGPPMPEYAHLIGHGSYEIAFRDSGLYAWLLLHTCEKCAAAATAGVQSKWKPLHHSASSE